MGKQWVVQYQIYNNGYGEWLDYEFTGNSSECESEIEEIKKDQQKRYVQLVEVKKITGIKKAVGQYNDWVGCANVMMDTGDNTVWCDVFVSGNSWNEYQSKSIIKLIGKGANMASNWDKTSMKEVKQIIWERGLNND